MTYASNVPMVAGNWVKLQRVLLFCNRKRQGKRCCEVGCAKVDEVDAVQDKCDLTRRSRARRRRGYLRDKAAEQVNPLDEEVAIPQDIHGRLAEASASHKELHLRPDEEVVSAQDNHVRADDAIA